MENINTIFPLFLPFGGNFVLDLYEPLICITEAVHLGELVLNTSSFSTLHLTGKSKGALVVENWRAHMRVRERGLPT